MTTSDDARNAMVTNLMSGTQVDRDKFIILTLLDIKDNGCAKACADPKAQEIGAFGNMFGTLQYKDLKVSGMAAVVVAVLAVVVAHAWYIDKKLDGLKALAAPQHVAQTVENNKTGG